MKQAAALKKGRRRTAKNRQPPLKKDGGEWRKTGSRPYKKEAAENKERGYCMQRPKRILLALLLSLALLAGLWDGYVPSQPAQAAGSFIDLNQKQIVEAMGAGWNLGNQLEANTKGTPKEDAWSGVKVTQELIRKVKTSGFNSIRIPVSWLSTIGDEPEYTIDETWLSRVEEVVGWAVKYNLYVVINLHGDGYSTVEGGWLLPERADQTQIKEKFAAVWKQIAARFKDYDHHLIFESMNEIGAELKADAQIKAAYENINDYNQIFVDAVRSSGGNNAKRWLLIPGFNTNIDYTAGDYGFQIPEDSGLSADVPEGEKRIMVSVHYYSPWEFCGQEDYNQTQWGDDADPEKSVGYGSESDMEAAFAKMKAKFVDKGYPVVIGEYGAIDKSKREDSGVGKAGEPDPENPGFRENFVWKLCATAKQNSCVPMYWDNGWNGDFGYAIFARGSQQDRQFGYRTAGEVTQPGILKAIMSCYGTKAGTAKAIDIQQERLTLDLNSAPQQLTATLDPADSDDAIVWSSTDTSVAGVNYKGKVSVRGRGTCLVIARTPGGLADYCIVEVKPPQTFMAGIYAQSSQWSDLSGADYIEIAENGTKEAEVTLQASKELFSPIRTLFIKDVAVQNGASNRSNLSSATFVVKSLKFNDTEMELDKTEYPYNRESTNGALDICLVNAWDAGTHHIKGMTKASQGYSFPADSYVDGVNTISVTLEIKDAVLGLEQEEEVTEAESLSFAEDSFTVEAGETASAPAVIVPSEATEKVMWFSEDEAVASVSEYGAVTGVKAGKTTIHAVTASGRHASLSVTVVRDPLASGEPELPPEPSLPPLETDVPGDGETAAPGDSEPAEPTDAPGDSETAEPTDLPGANGTAAPGDSETAAPTDVPGGSGTAAPTEVPGANGTAAPGTNETAAPGGSQTAAPTDAPGDGGTATPTQKPGSGNSGAGKKVTVKKATIRKVASKKKKTLTIQWKKVSGASGYQVKAGTDKKASKGKKTVTVKKAAVVKTTIKKLKSGKRYYARVRAYKTVKGKKYYGSWSAAKSAKVK